jgi:hypothetical protein
VGLRNGLKTLEKVHTACSYREFKHDSSNVHLTRAVESVHRSSDCDSSIFKTSYSDSFIKAQYALIMVNLQDISSPPRESSGYFLDL